MIYNIINELVSVILWLIEYIKIQSIKLVTQWFVNLIKKYKTLNISLYPLVCFDGAKLNILLRTFRFQLFKKESLKLELSLSIVCITFFGIELL